MAKGLRASTNKANKTKLRSKVFAPVEIARNERLSAKLMEIASQRKSSSTSDVKMDDMAAQGMRSLAILINVPIA